MRSGWRHSISEVASLGSVVDKIRSKNAGPFWVTIDIFCGSAERFRYVNGVLETDRVATLFHANPATVRRFEIPDLAVIKFSLPRPVVQGHRRDRDMHGAGWAVLLAELEVVPPS